MRKIVVVALLGGALVSNAAAAPLAVRARIDTPNVQFGEPIRTHVVILLDRARVRPESVHIVDPLAPLTLLTSPHRTRAVEGDTLVVAVERTASCLGDRCVAARGDATPRLPRVVVTARARDGRLLRAQAAWPELHVRGRVSAAELARARPAFRADLSPPAPSYRISPSTLAWLLDALAVVLGLAAVAVAAHQASLLARRRRVAAPVDELGRALRLSREAEHRPVADRRRAVGLLARLLASRDRGLARKANELAWSRTAPEAGAVEALVVDVEQEVGE
jgi:hypothetical protein